MSRMPSARNPEFARRYVVSVLEQWQHKRAAMAEEEEPLRRQYQQRRAAALQTYLTTPDRYQQYSAVYQPVENLLFSDWRLSGGD